MHSRKFRKQGITGNYTFKENAFFYEGHFKENPITPGVLLIETMAQIGVVCLGIYLLKNEISSDKKPKIALTSSQVDFFIPVLPNEKSNGNFRKRILPVQ